MALEDTNKHILVITREKIYQQLKRMLLADIGRPMRGKLKAYKTVQEGITYNGAIYPGKITFQYNPMDTMSGQKAHNVTCEILIRGDGHDFDNAALYDFLEDVVGRVNTWFTENWKCGEWFSISRVQSGDPLVRIDVGKEKQVAGARVVVEGNVIRNYTYETS